MIYEINKKEQETINRLVILPNLSQQKMVNFEDKSDLPGLKGGFSESTGMIY